MADYYPLLERAVAKLKDNTPEARQAIYERARNALFGQLRSLDPPVQEETIEREAQALEVAIAQLETHALRSAFEIAFPAAEPDFYGLYPPVGGDGSATGETLPNEKAAPQSEPSGSVPDSETTAPQSPALRFRRKTAKKQTDSTAETVADSLSGAGPLEQPHSGAALRDAAANSAAEASDSPSAGGLAGSGTSARKRLEIPHASSLQLEPGQAAGHKKRLIAVGTIAGLIVVFVAIAAYRLRDRPEDLVPVPPPAAQGQGASAGKIADRVEADRANSSVSPAPTTGSSTAASVSDAARPGSGLVGPPLAVARRAALLVESRDERSKVNTYVGAVVWRAENISSGPDEPLRTAVHALIDIPQEKCRVDVLIQKNFDSTLPASHTVKLVFALSDDSPLGRIKQISTLQMREEDTPTGDSLKGITVPIVDNSFLIGLARGDAEAANLERLQSREWLDVPMVLDSGLIAKLTFEKGPAGQRILDDALASWQAK